MNQQEQMRLLIESNKELYGKVEFKQEVIAFLNTKTGKYLIDRAEKERDDAMRLLVNTPCVESAQIAELQSTVKRAESIQFWLAEIIQEGVSAEETLLSQDRAVDGDGD